MGRKAAKKRSVEAESPKEGGFTVVDKRGKEPEPEEVVDIGADKPVEMPFDPYPRGIIGVAESGFYVPVAGRVLAYAIMPGDHKLTGAGLDNITTTKGALCFEIVAIADDVPESWPGRVGMHFKDASASADSLDPEDATCRWWEIWWNDVVGLWWPPEEGEDGEPVYSEVTLDGGMRNVPMGMYPLQAQADPSDPRGKAWVVADGSGEVVLRQLNERSAVHIADAINARAARHDPAAPFAISVPVAQQAPEPEAVAPVPPALAPPQVAAPAPPQPPQVRLGPDLYDGLTYDEQQAVYMAAQTSGPQAAVAVADNYRRIKAMTSREAPQPLPFPNPPGQGGSRHR